ncbi:hypothetical protein [Photobacterium sanguinicancri]|uniref:hypothetical protein n=1 Tax=Photobacterium sanguinicancri TaxID=875932 RepID=UPI000787B7F9|nr:hypothetical protein [Photobacterium sanguinicancri]KXI21746.1 hypothetical protein AS132_19090 [Photobacterium sanguinicancri]
MDAHSAEHHYYDKGNTVEDYPSRSVVIKNYYEDLGYFSHPKEITHRKLTDFVEVNLIGKRLMISPLISINELNKFIAERPDYIDYRGGDILSSVNNEEDLTLPASVTWFDAMAYLNWFEETRKTPARLLTAHEYSLLRAKDDITKAQESQASDLNFLNLNSEGDVLFQSNSYISTDNYPLAVVRFGNVNRYTNSFGIEFMCSNSFAEWLMEETCIRSGSLKSFYHNDNVIRSRPSASSTGAYKGVKTGFRICYELDF